MILSTVLLFACFVLSFALALYFVPLMRKAALKWGVLDRPDGRLKRQTEAVPYLGGIALYLSFLLALSLVFDFSPQIMGLLLAGTIMLLIGLVDDFGVLLPYQKFAGQILATFVLVKAGIYIKVEFFPVWLSILLTFFWILGTINAVNIIDIADGLASGVVFCACLILFIVAMINGHETIAMITVALAGSLLGFLVFNFNPAKIYLGDAGSLFIGIMVGALAMMGDYSARNDLGYINPLLILGVPIFDTAFVMAIRAQKGLPVFLGSPDHYAIRLMRIGFSVRQVALLSYAITLLLGVLAIINMYLTPWWSLGIIAALALLAVGLFVLLGRIKV